jgi:hypothetical protein
MYKSKFQLILVLILIWKSLKIQQFLPDREDYSNV